MKRLLLIVLLLPLSASAQQWKLIAPMKDARSQHTGALLNDGRILIVSGSAVGSGIVSTCEIYDPITDTWSLASKPNTTRLAPCVKLSDGRIYIAGGLTDLTVNNVTTTAEIYDPVSNVWNYTSPLLMARESHSMKLLGNGEVLVVGGVNPVTGNWFSECELYNPSLPSQSVTGSIDNAQYGGALFYDNVRNMVVKLGDNFGGASGTYYATSQEYDVISGRWTVTGNSSVSHGVGDLQSLQLPDGKILVPSGVSGPPPSGSVWAATPVIEIYDPPKKIWKIIGNLRIPRYTGTSVYIGDDSVIVIGGLDGSNGAALDDCEIINLKTGIVTAGPKLNVGRAFHYMQVMHSKDSKDACIEITRIYVFGGMVNDKVNQPGTALASCEMIEYRHAASSTLNIPQPLSFTGNVCTGFDTSITISGITCTDLKIDSARLEGFSFSSVSAKLPDTLKNGDKKIFQLSLHGTNAGITQGKLRIFYNIGGNEMDTSISIAVTMQASSRGTIRSIIHDISDGRDTILVPIYLASNSGDKAEGFSLTAHFNTDLLSPIDPEFKGTLSENAVVWDQNQISDGMNIFTQQPFSVSSSKPLVILKFKSYVTKEECTSFVIDNLQIAFDTIGGKSDPCPLAVIGDSATICRANNCGEPSLRQFLRTGEIPIFKVYYDNSNDRIMVNDPIKLSHSIEVLNMLGEVVKRMSVSGENTVINAAVLPAGIYIIRSSDGGRKYSAKIIISR